MDKYNWIDQRVQESIRVKEDFSPELKATVLGASEAILKSHRESRRVWTIGNGGSAADAQHFACELVGRFMREREPVSVTALTTDSTVLTAVMNDYAERPVIFERQVRAHVRAGDVLIALSTSGRSPNIVAAVRTARKQGGVVIAMTGRDGGDLRELSDYLIAVPSDCTPRIQEAHGLIVHLICEWVERALDPAEG